MKVGRAPDLDLERVQAARFAIGDKVELFVDANGAYTRKQALAFAEKFAPLGVTWFEEPVSSDDLEGLRLLRDRSPAVMDIAAGEYGFDTFRKRQSNAVSVKSRHANWEQTFAKCRPRFPTIGRFCVVIDANRIVLGLLEMNLIQDSVGSIEKLMQPAPLTLRPSVLIADASAYFDESHLIFALVTKSTGELIGAIRRIDLEDGKRE
jgi:Enolase C-terminal domain-like